MLHKYILKILSPVKLGGVFDDDLDLEGQQLDKVLASAEALLAEVFADTTTEALLLPLWEKLYEITPDPTETLQERRNSVIMRIRAKGGQSRQYFIDLLAALGLSATIEEYSPAYVGHCYVGHCWTYSEGIIYVWTVSITGWVANLVLQAKVENICNLLKPAHTVVYFEYLP